jgi:hypothetical protein
MKKIITIVGVMVFVVAIGTVLADQMPIMTTESRDVGTLLNIEAPGKVLYAAPAKDFGRPLVSEAPLEVGAGLYLSAFEKSEAVTGAAAGGITREDEKTRIWDNLMPRGESLE